MWRFCSVPLPVPNPYCHFLFVCFLFGGICAVLCWPAMCFFKLKKNYYYLVLEVSYTWERKKNYKSMKRNFTYIDSSEWILEKCPSLNKFCRMHDPSQRGLLVLNKKSVRWWLLV